MKNQKGITLTALTIYVIIFTIVISIVATLTSYFYKNVINFDETTKSYSEINKFNMFFLQDFKKKNTIISNLIEENEEKVGITLYNSDNYETNIYKFEDSSKAIYRNGNLICKNIESVKFEIDNNILKVYIETQGVGGVVKTMLFSINS